MRSVQINEAQPGMILAKDVVGRFGRSILKAGNSITDKHLRIFKSWGITELQIQSLDPYRASKQDLPPPKESLMNGGESDLRELFKFNDFRHPAIRELYRFLILRNGKKG